MELLRTLAVLAQRPGPDHGRLAGLLDLPGTPDEATWTQIFVLHLYPYASVHLGDQGKLGGEARDRVAGFFRALDAVPPAEPDHLPTLLAAHAELAERGEVGDQQAAHAATTLLHEHLLSWLPLYLGRVNALAPEPYRSWADLLAEVLRDQARLHPATRGIDGTLLLPAHLRDAPSVADPRDGADLPLPEQLLIPVRTGFVLTGADLRRAARETSLGLRIGERRYVLEQLLAQSVPDTLHWIAHHATTTHHALAPWQASLPGTTTWWTDRADTTSALLLDLASEAHDAVIVPA